MPHRWFPALERSTAYRWYQKRRGFFAVAGFFLACVVGFAIVQGAANDAQDSSNDAERAADKAEKTSQQNRKLAAANSRLNCGLAKLIRGSPIIRRPDETPEAFTRRIITTRDFARDVRILATLLDRFDLAGGAKCEVSDLRIRLTPTDRAALVPEILDRALGGDDPIAITPISPPTTGARGGDAVGSDPGGGGGPPGGEEPPAEQGALDPIIDPTPPVEECHLSIAGVTLCTEPD